MDRLDQLAKEYNVVIQGRAFLLRPDIPEEGMRREPRPGEEGDQLSEPLRTSAIEAGLVMRRASLTPYTMYALEATEYAQQQGQFNAFHHSMYKALWEDGKNLGDLSVIQEIAEGCDLNWPELSQRLETGYYRPAVQQQFQQAQDLGIHGIPAFLVDNLLFTGAQPYQVFKTVVERAMGLLATESS